MNDEYTLLAAVGNDQLTADGLAVRYQVFVQEQHISQELDVDGEDPEAYQVVIYAANAPVATGRMLMHEAQIGRIAVVPAHRKRGLSVAVLDELERYAAQCKLVSVKLTPHMDLLDYYRKRGYEELPDSRFTIAGHELTTMRKDLIK